MAVTSNAKLVMFLYLLFLSFLLTTSDDADEAEILRVFRNTIADPLGSLNSWNSNTGPCMKPAWVGVICLSGHLFEIQLENMGLSGPLSLDVLTSLPRLRALSFMNNNFSGPLPDLKKFQGLKNVFFSMNQFEGEIPDDAFDGMQSLKRVNLSMNRFTGRIPSSLAWVNSLSGLWLNDNDFVGEIPDFEQTGLLACNVSNNNLEGRIPDTLSKLDPSNFSGNENLCGPPTKLQCQN